MTLCIAWRSNGTVHFASDSRLTVAANSYADVGIKVMSLPYTVLEPAGQGDEQRAIAFTGDLGLCFAGSVVSSLTLKESIVEVLKTLQYAPRYTDTSMAGIADFIFTAYKIVSKEICRTALGSNGRASILIGGMCRDQKRVRVFHFSTDNQNRHNIEEVLTGKPHCFVGSGSAAEDDVPQHPDDSDYLNVLRSVIQDDNVPTVGGHIQYGCFKGDRFTVYGVFELGDTAHYWRGALDLNSVEFLAGHASFVPGIPYIDPFRTISG